MNNPIKAVLFDIDGTILNCHGAGRLSLIKATKEIFGTTGLMDNVNFQGKTDPQILHESLINIGISEKEISDNMTQLMKTYFKYLRKNIIEHKVTLLPGIVEILNKLTENKSVMPGLLTGNFKESAKIKLSKYDLNNYFLFGVFGSDTPARNDMPQIAKNRIKKRFLVDIDYKDMIIIGDTVHDINCAKNAGAISISVGTGWTEKGILLENNPDYFFEDMSNTDQIADIILN